MLYPRGYTEDIQPSRRDWKEHGGNGAEFCSFIRLEIFDTNFRAPRSIFYKIVLLWLRASGKLMKFSELLSGGWGENNSNRMIGATFGRLVGGVRLAGDQHLGPA